MAGLVLIGFIVIASMRVAHHAERLAEKVGDPYGSMILTYTRIRRMSLLSERTAQGSMSQA